MRTSIDMANPRVRNIRILQDDIEADKVTKKSRGVIYRLRLESIIYRSLKIIGIGAVLAAVYRFPGFTNTIYLPVALGVMVLLRALASFEIPHFNLMPIRKNRRNIRRYLKGEIIFIFLTIAVVYFLKLVADPLYLGLFLAINFIVQTILFAGWHKYNQNHRAGEISAQLQANKNIIIVGADNRGKQAADLILKYPDLNIKILGFVDYHKQNLWRYRDIPLLGHPDQIENIVANNQVDYVIMAVKPEDFLRSQQIFNAVERMGINICLLPQIYDMDMARCRASSINGQPVLLYHTNHENSPRRLFIKEAMDRIGSLFGLIISAPILIIAAIAIKLETKGPILFKQERSGKNGRRFKMLKLRTMINDADEQKDKLAHLNEMSGPVFKIKNDPRVTKVGRILRKLSIDEFPQFINILNGDMSLVGPRPPLEKEVKKFESWQRRKLSVKPGATCLWQINGRNAVDFEHWMQLDLEYIDNWSLKEDTRIILKTLPAILKGNGAS